jgi:hypothetical protein
MAERAPSDQLLGGVGKGHGRLSLRPRTPSSLDVFNAVADGPPDRGVLVPD